MSAGASTARRRLQPSIASTSTFTDAPRSSTLHVGARGGSRTPKGLHPPDPKSGASASFATLAGIEGGQPPMQHTQDARNPQAARHSTARRPASGIIMGATWQGPRGRGRSASPARAGSSARRSSRVSRPPATASCVSSAARGRRPWRGSASRAGTPNPARSSRRRSPARTRSCTWRARAWRAAAGRRRRSAGSGRAASTSRGAWRKRSRGSEILREDSAPGPGFLAEVCREWEAATDPAARAGIRVVRLRIGMVLSRRGGALGAMLTPFRLGAGGPVGRGAQWVSWISIDDLVGAILHALATESLAGPVNAVAPEPVTNRELARTLGRVLRRPALLPLPAVAARLLFGQMADELLLASARVEPARLRATGFTFRHARLEDALRHELGRPHRTRPT